MTRVVIAGAGPTGLTAAVELARRGIEVTILERRAEPSGLSRAVGILAGSLALLEPSGAAAAIRAEAVRFAGILAHRDGRRIARLMMDADPRRGVWGLAQDRTEAHLQAALARFGATVRFATPVEAVRQDPDRVSVVAGGAELRADYLIGADGTRSTVRACLGLGFPGHDLPGTWSIADIDLDALPDPGFARLFLLGRRDVLVVVPMEATRCRVVASTADALAALPARLRVARVRRQGTFTIAVRQVAHYRVGRVFLAGDAAHCHSPVGGRGMNLGIADAADLARRIAHGDLDGYGAARHAAGRQVLAFSERARRLVQAEAGVPRAALVAGLRLAGAVPPLGRALMRGLAGG